MISWNLLLMPSICIRMVTFMRGTMSGVNTEVKYYKSSILFLFNENNIRCIRQKFRAKHIVIAKQICGIPISRIYTVYVEYSIFLSKLFVKCLKDNTFFKFYMLINLEYRCA